MRGAGSAQPAAGSESPSMKRAGIATVKPEEIDRVIAAVREIIK
jgi:hypothetical protein